MATDKLRAFAKFALTSPPRSLIGDLGLAALFFLSAVLSEVMIGFSFANAPPYITFFPLLVLTTLLCSLSASIAYIVASAIAGSFWIATQPARIELTAWNGMGPAAKSNCRSDKRYPRPKLSAQWCFGRTCPPTFQSLPMDEHKQVAAKAAVLAEAAQIPLGSLHSVLHSLEKKQLIKTARAGSARAPAAYQVL